VFHRYESAASASPAQRSFRQTLTAILLAILLLALFSPAALAAEMRPGDVIVVGPNETINDDLYAFGRTVDVLGTVRGDVIAGAAAVTISGTVSGDVIASAGQVRIPGEVSGSVRAGAGDVSIDGRVGEDVVVGAGNLTIGSRASVGRDVYTGTGSARLDARVGRNVFAGAGDVTIGGQVGGNVEAEVGSLRLNPGASINGQLRYKSDSEAEIAQGASVQGGIQRNVRERRGEEQPPNRALDIFIVWIRSVIGLFVFGLLLEVLSPGIGARTMATVSRSPGMSVVLGLVLLLIVPFAALVTFVFGLLVGGWWIGLIILAAYAIALISSVPLAGIAVGRWVLERFGRPIHWVWALLLGVVIITLVGLVPIAGFLLVGLAALLAFGGLILSTFRRPSPPAPPEPSALPEPAAV